ncbi:hypothetical protein ENBRE01_1259 [Enteropsectra breve]|nr:hypothetical protein ENBRE01_1259 [Enteropsectra breve]
MKVGENQEIAVATIKKLAKEIQDNLSGGATEIKGSFLRLGEKSAVAKSRIQEERARLEKTSEHVKAANQALIQRRHAIEQSIQNDAAEMQQLEDENINFEKQHGVLTLLNKTLSERKNELTEKYANLNSRYSTLKAKRDLKLKEQHTINQHYKTFLGLDIHRVRDHCIKIVFSHFSTECSTTIDFNREDCVIECMPELNLERLNFAFKEKGCFYKFAQYLRNEFKKAM